MPPKKRKTAVQASTDDVQPPSPSKVTAPIRRSPRQRTQRVLDSPPSGPTKTTTTTSRSSQAPTATVTGSQALFVNRRSIVARADDHALKALFTPGILATFSQEERVSLARLLPPHDRNDNDHDHQDAILLLDGNQDEDFFRRSGHHLRECVATVAQATRDGFYAPRNVEARARRIESDKDKHDRWKEREFEREWGVKDDDDDDDDDDDGGHQDSKDNNRKKRKRKAS